MAIAIDSETALITDDAPVPRATSVALAWGSKVEDSLLLHHSEAEDTLGGVIRDATAADPIVFARAPFDGAVFCSTYPALESSWWQALRAGAVADVLDNEKMLDLADGFGLKREYNLGAVAMRRAGYPVDKTDPWRLRYGELVDVPIHAWPVEAVHYATHDPIATWAVHDAQVKVRYGDLDPLVDAPAQARGHWALYLSALHGVIADPAKVAALAASLAADRESLRSELQRIQLVRADGSVNMSVAQGLAKEAGVTRETKRGLGLSADDFALLNLSEEHPLVRMLQYKGLKTERTKLLNAYGRPVIRPFYNNLLETGRVSASNPNTTNQPRKGGYRECLVPRPGKCFVKGDWSGMQLKCWAHLLVVMFGEDAPSAAMAQAMRTGLDVHAMLAATLEIIRQDAKPVNFGFIGGMGIPRFIDTVRQDSDGRVRLSEAQAWRYKRGWEAQWHPEAFFQWVADQVEAGGSVIQYRSERLRGGCGYSQLAMQLIQGMESDIAKETLFVLADAMYTQPDSPLYGARQVLFVHDENVLECDVADAPKVADELSRVMNEIANDWHHHVPSAVDVDILHDCYKK